MKTLMHNSKVLLCLLGYYSMFLLCNPLHAVNLPPLQLQVGDSYSYVCKYTDADSLGTGEEQTYWLTITVKELKDSVYKMNLQIDRHYKKSAEKSFDTRDGFYTEFDSPLLNVSIPFEITKSRRLMKLQLPDKDMQQRKADFAGEDFLQKMQLSIYYDQYESNLKRLVTNIFTSWNEANPKSYRLNYSDTPKANQFEVDYYYEADSIHITQQENENPYVSVVKMKNVKGTIDMDVKNGMPREVSFKSENQIIFFNDLYRVYRAISIKPYEKHQDIKLTVEVSDDYLGGKMHIFMFHNFIEYDVFDWEIELHPGISYSTSQTLKSPVALSAIEDNGLFPASFNNLLLEPGDDIIIHLSKDSLFYSGKGALKNSINAHYLELQRTPHKGYSVSMDKKSCLKRIDEQMSYLEEYRSQLSDWAYQHQQAEIYYGNLTGLLQFYYEQQGKSDAPSFLDLFSDININKYSAITSKSMQTFLNSYLYQKVLLMKGYEQKYTIPESEKYYLAGLMLSGKAKYLAQTNAVWQALKSNDTQVGNQLFQDYKKSYWESGFYKRLNTLYTTRVNLGTNQNFPKVNFTTMDGKQVSTDDFRGKYVQLLFINIEYEDRQNTMKAYQQFKSEMEDQPFELITVFVTPDEDIIKKYVKEREPKGILVANPDWKTEELKQFKMEFGFPYFLVNPEGVIIFSGDIGSYQYYLKQIKEQIKQTDFSKYEAGLSKRTLYSVLFGALVLMLIIVLVSIWVAHNIKRKAVLQQQKLEWQMSAVRSQLNPHFIFNAMNSIQYLVNQNDNKQANLFLSNFAKLMRKVLSQTEEEFTTLQNELETIQTYLDLEQLRHKFKFEIKMDSVIDPYNTEVPVMLMQPFVENAIVHGVASLRDKGKIEIVMKQISQGIMQICIADNGVGFSSQTKKPIDSNGKGILLTKKRMELLMQKYQNEITFEVINRRQLDPSVEGTLVSITIETEV